ncbi:MAG: hypothetical protein K5985_11165 [Lachnospiraceae bacterium]|nr:hypothetical protein [Lachnospiraceae bacterium]
MGKVEYQAGSVIHSADDTVSSLDVILAGEVTLSCGVTVRNGYMIGLECLPGEEYGFTYTAETDTTVFTYNYNEKDDLPKIIKLNPKISVFLTGASVLGVHDMLEECDNAFKTAAGLFEKSQKDYEQFRLLTGETVKLPGVEALKPPVPWQPPEWEKEYFSDLFSQDPVLRKSFYPLGNGICTGVILHASGFLREISTALRSFLGYQEKTNHELEGMAMRSQAASSSSGGDVPVVHDAMNTILNFSGESLDVTLKFKELVEKYRKTPQHNDTSDEMRALRMEITTLFYQIYKAIFLKARNLSGIKDVPLEIRLFLMFGFVDEKLVGEENTVKLSELAWNYKPDPAGRVLTLYEWLCKIYDMKVEPSRNEFDLDYPSYLREERTRGNLSEKQERSLLKDPEARLDFEMTNLFTLGNRMTFGRVITFLPILDEVNILRDVDTSYLEYVKISEIIKKIRSIDFSCFCRETVYSNQKVGIVQEYIQKEILPVFILMPNFGSRCALWQEIEGRNRLTPARMLLPIMTGEDLEKNLIKLCGEFRWEMCKRMQGVHWNDVTDPSLTSVYFDYLQFYRKNHEISPETREKIKQQLAKANNNYRNCFVMDYILYISFETAGSPRLNKIARDIMFTYCPPSKEIRDQLASNPQYEETIKRYRVKVSAKVHTMDNLIKKIQATGRDVPEEITEQYGFLHR